MNSRLLLQPCADTTSGARASIPLAAVALALLAALAGTPAYAASHSGGATAKPQAAAPAAPAASAPSGTCHQQATEKKLAGAAKNSFMGKCEKDATERCEAAAAEKKLAGAARNANVNKCVKDAVGG